VDHKTPSQILAAILSFVDHGGVVCSGKAGGTVSHSNISGRIPPITSSRRGQVLVVVVKGVSTCGDGMLVVKAGTEDLPIAST